MARRKRKHIPLKTKLAAALACLLPQSERDSARADKVKAEHILSWFEFHHIVFHAHDGSDEWWNLHPLVMDLHRKRSKGPRSDTSVIAKVKRLRATPVIAAGLPKPRYIMIDIPSRPKRKIPSRPFPKKHRPLRATNG